jgi:4-diphosphocytidyl-2-C-methyl-D-erythritol kinase
VPAGANARLTAPAKLTWSLRVVGVRADGYHLLDAEMLTLDLADELTISERDDGRSSLAVDGPFAAGVPTDESNLVHRALRAAGRSADVHVVKRIPNGGGLGGGSADAAAVLRWAGIADPLAAAAVGADVPFCVVGGRARVSGIGEVVEPLDPVDRTVTLVVPPVHVSTPDVYRAWDELAPGSGQRNDLEPAAIVVAPELAEWRDRIAALSGVLPVLAGSGATWFVEGDLLDALSPLRAAGATVVNARSAPPAFVRGLAVDPGGPLGLRCGPGLG